MGEGGFMPGVAGVYAPAFVERTGTPATTNSKKRSVAGVYAPAFVERHDRYAIAKPQSHSVAGVYAPAFVERTSREPSTSTWTLTLPRFPGHLVKIHCRSRISGCGSCWQRGALSKRRWKSGVDFHGRVSFHS